MTTVYHGTSIHNLSKLRSGKSVDWYGLYVTDTAERATRYANAQATRTVDAQATTLAPHAAVVVMETDENIIWRRRDDNHHTLDTCETVIKTWRIVDMIAVECDYAPCTCHKAI